MCLGVPMRLLEVDADGTMALAETLGVRRRISVILLTEPPKAGDWVMVHVGYALEHLEYEEAQEILALLDAVSKEVELRAMSGG